MYNFYGSIFNDPSVIVDQESYNNFVNLLREEVDYLAKKNLYTAEEVYEDPGFENGYVLLQNAFSAINVGLTMEYGGMFGQPSALVFTLPNGEIRKLNDLDSYYSSITFNSKLRVTDEYFEQMMPYYTLQKEEIKDLNIIGANAAGRNTRWQYDSVTHTIEVSGNGSLANYGLWDFLGIDSVDTIIIGSGVNRMETGSIDSYILYIDFHGQNDEIIFENNFASSGEIYLYTDCESWYNAPWPSNTIVNIYPLSEWNG